jgi:oligopeptide/dipeptide ABC transporter ATP-binding protein
VPILSVENLVQVFPVAGSKALVRAVNDVSFALDRGETLALVGESGSGKTTIGRCLLGLITPTSGRIEFNGMLMGGKRSVRSPEVHGKLQLVFQEPAESLDPRMRLHQIIEEPLRTLGHDRTAREKLVREAARRVGLPEWLMNRYPAEISMGLQQRVGIARAIVSKPEIIVLDEPTSALDPTARAEIIDLLIGLQRELGTAYLFISHDLSAVRQLSHRLAVLYLGMIVEQGQSAELFARPRHPYTVGLLSSVLLPNPKIKRFTQLKLSGEIPSPIDLPKACFLAGRCPLAVEQCRAVMPPVDTIAPGHTVRCYRTDEVARMEQAIDYFGQFQAEADRILGAGIPGSADLPTEIMTPGRN